MNSATVNFVDLEVGVGSLAEGPINDLYYYMFLGDLFNEDVV